MQEEMRLQDYIRISFLQLWKNRFLIAAVTLLFFLMGILLLSWQNITNTYYAKSTVYTIYGATTQEISMATSALLGYSDVIRSKKVCERAEAIIGEADITADYIKNAITTSYNKTSTVMTIAAYSENSETAMKIANAMADAFVEEIQAITGNDRIQVLDKAEEVQVSNDGLKGLLVTTAIAGFAGFAISVLVIVGGVIFSNKIKSVEQCLDEEEEEILGIVPYIE